MTRRTGKELYESFCNRFNYDITSPNFEPDELFKKRIIGSKEWAELRHNLLEKYNGKDVFKSVYDNEDVDAELIHHIVSVSDNPELAFDESNLIPLSQRTHALIHIQYTKSGVVKAVLQELQRKSLQTYKGGVKYACTG